MRFSFIILLFFLAGLASGQNKLSLVDQYRSEADSLMSIHFDSTTVIELYHIGTRLATRDVDHAKKVIDYLERVGNSKGDQLAIGISVYLNGLIIRLDNKYILAVKKFSAAERIFIALNHRKMLSETKRQSAILFGLSGRYRMSIEAFKEAIEYADSTDIGFFRRVSKSIGSRYSLLGEEKQDTVLLDSAIYYSRQYCNYSRAQGRTMQYAYSDLGLRFLKSTRMGRKYHFDSAKFYLERGLEIAIEESDKTRVRITNHNLGSLYLLSFEHEKSLFHNLAALKIAKEQNRESSIQAIFDNLRMAYAMAGMSNLALAYADSSYKMVKVKATKKAELLENLISDFYVKQNEQEIAIHESKLAEERTFRNALILVLSLCAIIIILLFLIQRNRSKANKILSQKNKHIRQVEELKSRWFANVSHDFRSPLTLIKGHMDTIRRDENFLTERSESSLEKATKNVDQLVILTNEIRDLTLLDASRLKLNYNKVSIYELIKLNVGMFSSMAEYKSINLSFEANIDKETVIHADSFNLEKILFNLISNAIKYTQEGGKVDVHLSELNDKVIVQIKDNGQGILAEEIPHVFDRYFQASTNDYKVQEGLGIGLSLVRELVELHGGTIGLESVLETGTTFTVTLPYNLQEPTSESTQSSYVQHRTSIQSQQESNLPNEKLIPIGNLDKNMSSRKSILVVDDHREVREYICSLIEEKYHVVQAKNGQEAFDFLKKQKVDLVMTDLMMPWMDGFELIEKIKSDEQLKDIKLMVISARSGESDKHRILDQGVNNFLSKPFNSQELFMRIENLLNGAVNSTWNVLAKKQDKLSDIERNLLKKVNDLIVSRIDDSRLTVKWLSEELAASERSVNRIIKNLTGTSPKAYVQRVRMSYAEELLRKKKVHSVSEASLAVGVKNVTDFSKHFEREKGMQPAELLS